MATIPGLGTRTAELIPPWAGTGEPADMGDVLGLRARLESGFESWGRFLFRHARIVIALSLVLTAAVSTGLGRLELDTSTEGFLRQDDPVRNAYFRFRDQFGRDGLIVIGVRTARIFDLDFLTWLRAFHDDLESETPHLDDIKSLINARNTRGEGDELIVEDLFERWPRNAIELARIEARARSNPLYENLYLSRDGHFTTIMIRLDTYSSAQQGGAALEGFDDSDTEGAAAQRSFLTGDEIDASIAAIKRAIARHETNGAEISLAGEPVLVNELQNAMRTEMTRFVQISLVVIGALLWILFRRISGLILPLLVVGISVLWTLAIMAFSGVPIEFTTQILPTFLLAVGVGASVHILTIVYQGIDRGLDREAALAHALGHSGLPVIMTSLTTAGGLVSFVAAELAPIGHFGIFTPIGVLLTLVWTLVFLPAAIAVAPIRPRRARSAPGGDPFLDRMLFRCGDIATRRPWPVLGVSAALVVASFLAMGRLRLAHDPLKWFPPQHPFRTAMGTIDREFRGSMSVEMVIRTAERNGLEDPDILKRLERLRTWAESFSFNGITVGKATSLPVVVKEINQALHGNRAEFYSIPDDRALVAQELLLFENSGSDDLEEIVDSNFQLARFSMRVPWHDAIDYPPFVDALMRKFTEVLGDSASVEPNGVVAVMTRTIRAVINSMVRSYLISLSIITPMMILLIGSLRGGLLSMVPNLFPVIVTLGLMGWARFPIDIFTLMVGSIAIGLAVDDTIHFMHNFQRYFDASGDPAWSIHETLRTTGRAMLFTSLVLTAGFSIYMLSMMRNIVNFGLLTGFCIVTAFLADVLISPALLILVRGRRRGMESEPVATPQSVLHAQSGLSKGGA